MLFEASVGCVQVSPHWFLSRDGSEEARKLFDRHYSRRRYADGRDPKLFVGPGEKMVLITKDCDALFVWRKFICDVDPAQDGVNCAVFRNESQACSSCLIREAVEVARTRWPGQRFWTLVNGAKVKSTNPGYCFQMAGWRREGNSKTGLLILAL